MKSFGVTSVLLLTLVLASRPSTVEAQVLRPGQLCSDHPDAAIATFEDANLEARVRSALSVGEQDDLTCGLVSRLTELTALNAEIESLLGIQNLTSLTTLFLGNDYTIDVSAVSGLSEISGLSGVISDTELRLFISNNPTIDLDLLSGLAFLNSNSISDIRALSGLTRLTELRLDNNSITDISALSGLTSLTDLRLDNNSITDIGALSGLSRLTRLRIHRNSITDISALARLTSLTVLRLDNNSITDISALSGLTSLTSLRLSNNPISDISALGGLTSLTVLRLNNNPNLTDIQPLLDNPGLGAGDEVRFGNTSVGCTDLAWLAAKGVSVDGVLDPELSCVPLVVLPDEPVVFNTFEQPQVRVVIVTKGLSHPWGMAFLPDGGILVTERAGRLRVIRDGVLDPEPIEGVPEVFTRGRAGLLDIALHPRFVDNNLVYLTYSKPGEDGATIALARGRFDGAALRDVRDIFVADPWGGVSYAGSRIVFAPDGTLYMTVGGAFGGPGPLRGRAQDPSAHVGKVLRLRDDGSVPDDNPFVGRAGYKPEIFSLGHRNQEGAAIHPETGALWTSEHAPQGGDEVNVILAGRNYGWPLVSYGREYDGPRVAEQPWQTEMEPPVIVWLPSIAPSGLTFYTGDRFPAWQGNLFAGGMMTGRIRGTGHLERIVLNRNGEELRRESLLTELKQRIRDVQQGPDGLIYVLTDEDDGALLRIEPAG